MVSKDSDNYQYSVLMSVYHKENAEYLRTAMDSIWNQTIPTDDFVLVCDGPLNEGLDAVIEKMEEEFQLMYLASIIVDSAFNFFKIERITSDKGKPPFELKDMIKLIFYGYINKITSSMVLAHNAKFNYLYNLISHAIEPKD